MNRWTLLFLSVLCCLAGPPSAAAPFDGITLRVSSGPLPGNISLQWDGGDPIFTIYRSTDPASVVNPPNQLGISDLRAWTDSPPKGAIFYYIVTSPCVYNPPEVCNGIDDDCDGILPPDEVDADHDGVRACDGDCDDSNAAVFPGHPEVCDNLDNDCNERIDGFTTACGVGACATTGFCLAGVDSCTPFPPSTEVCNGLDDDCNGVVDGPGSELSCSFPHASALCIGGACVAGACSAGFSDCNAVASDGCECNTAGCCGTACQVTHSNGLGQHFFDCVALGTYNAATATEAAFAWMPAGSIVTLTCGTGAQSYPVIVNQTASSCAVWSYTRTAVGHVNLNAGTPDCFCPGVADPIWN